jgi:hypothetical protein
MIYKTLHRKLKIEQDGDELMCSGRVNSFFSPCVTLVTSFSMSLTVENGAAQSVKILIPMDINVIISDQCRIYL